MPSPQRQKIFFFFAHENSRNPFFLPSLISTDPLDGKLIEVFWRGAGCGLTLTGRRW
jgi:hypothetical protein